MVTIVRLAAGWGDDGYGTGRSLYLQAVTLDSDDGRVGALLGEALALFREEQEGAWSAQVLQSLGWIAFRAGNLEDLRRRSLSFTSPSVYGESWGAPGVGVSP
jgi:hypothetical protein